MPRVLLVYHNPLFAHSIRVALRDQPQLDLVGEIDDWSHGEEALARLAPDVVIVEDEEGEAAEATVRALALRETPWRVIALRLDEATMHVWSGAWQTVTSRQDLIDTLLATPRLPSRPQNLESSSQD